MLVWATDFDAHFCKMVNSPSGQYYSTYAFLKLMYPAVFATFGTSEARARILHYWLLLPCTSMKGALVTNTDLLET